MASDRCNCYFSFLDCFLPFYPPNNPKNENFKKMKKTETKNKTKPGDAITTQVY